MHEAGEGEEAGALSAPEAPNPKEIPNFKFQRRASRRTLFLVIGF
jgi:hypothetical protein